MNQAFNPIFAPVVAGMTATGDHNVAAATYARLAEWMLWILLPWSRSCRSLAARFYSSTVQHSCKAASGWGSSRWPVPSNAFVSLGETVIMVQRPHLNLLNSSITCAVAFGGNLWLIPRFGVTGAAFGILLPYIVQGILRYGVCAGSFDGESVEQYPLP